MNRIILLSALVLLLFLSACSTVNTTNSTKAPDNEVYVFDDASDLEEELEEETPVEEPVVVKSAPEVKTIFIVQVGAFSTKGRAERFKQENSSKLSYELKISYSSKVGLFVVQLPEFETRTEAESVRNKLWKDKVFSDAFILAREK